LPIYVIVRTGFGGLQDGQDLRKKEREREREREKLKVRIIGG